MSYKNIKYGVEDGIAEIRFDRDDIFNTMSRRDMAEEVVDAFGRVERDRDARVLILSGEGRAFSAGGNLKDLDAGEDGFTPEPIEHRRHYFEQIQIILRAQYACSLPMIAAVHGPAIGGGTDMAALCDIVIATPKAVFCEMFVNLGLIPGTGGAWLMPRRIGWQAAADLLLTGRKIGGQEAFELGLAYKCVEPDQLMPTVRDYAKMIASRPPNATRFIKTLMKQGLHQTYTDVLDNCATMQAVLQTTDDHKKALAAALNKAPTPEYSGH